VQKEIVKADRSANVRVYFVWLPMLPSDDESEARGMARRLASSGARHFYDPQRRAGIAFVQDHFQDYIREALAVLPKDHPFRERLAQRAEVPASESPLWDAVMFFAPGADWNSKSPRPDWWAKQIGFHGEGARGNPTGQFLRNQIKDGPTESDWFAETREGMRLMSKRVSP
jgi:hypothetical protein